MDIDRRAALGLITGSLTAGVLATGRARALGAPAEGQAPGYVRFGLGDATVTIVSDGNLITPASLLGVNADPAEVRAFLEARKLSSEVNYAHTNHVVVETGEATVLVDVGSGDKFQPSAGRLLANMEAAGIDPAAITHVALTHAHPDHVWGMMDDFGDEPRIPEAGYAIGAAEFDWWMKEGRVDDVEDGMKAFVVGAQNALAPVAERMEMVADGAEIAPGVTMIDTLGHTLGHMSAMVESGGERLLVLGDAINHGHVSFERPDWQFGFDMDREQAVATRRRLLDMAAADGIAVAGYHLPFPGVGHVVREGSAYRFLPALVRWTD